MDRLRLAVRNANRAWAGSFRRTHGIQRQHQRARRRDDKAAGAGGSGLRRGYQRLHGIRAHAVQARLAAQRSGAGRYRADDHARNGERADHQRRSGAARARRDPGRAARPQQFRPAKLSGRSRLHRPRRALSRPLADRNDRDALCRQRGRCARLLRTRICPFQRRGHRGRRYRRRRRAAGHHPPLRQLAGRPSTRRAGPRSDPVRPSRRDRSVRRPRPVRAGYSHADGTAA